jgi:hypothetical protein
VASQFDVDAGGGGVCSPVCDPVTAAGCPAGAACKLIADNDLDGVGVTYAECQLPGSTPEGCDCSGSYSQQCVGNTSCRFLTPTSPTCSTLCVLGTNCADGTPCQVDTPRYVVGGTAYGYCQAPTCP